MNIDACPVCGAEALIIQCHDAIFLECPSCDAPESLGRWCEENTDLPLLVTNSVAQALTDWAAMCAAYLEKIR